MFISDHLMVYIQGRKEKTGAGEGNRMRVSEPAIVGERIFKIFRGGEQSFSVTTGSIDMKFSHDLRYVSDNICLVMAEGIRC